ncbi:toll/interleukin-1 receptor domain-containing protein [Herbidospora daliensis]|uniref:toll/interleukin-1 receptor domain-containing protein n=1 Tax=Herbidospora daliensis TaxID=295585 RepID=UPI00078539AA|nr:toll/interleukin-1 receptor domain-containing protein [Herbidospora daliensis]
MNATNAAGFWSYTHRDDQAEGGRLLRLAESVREEYALLTGDDLEIFVDREGIEWGDEWRQRIDQALQSTTFFIPIITTRYLRSHECRRELLRFAGKAESLGVKELFLPIVYAPIRQLDTGEDDDEIVALVRRTHFQDWRELRLLDENSAAYRAAVHALAGRLVRIAENLQENPPALPTPEELAGDAWAGEGPGIVDVMAEAEKAVPAWASTIDELRTTLTELGVVVTPMAARIQESDQAGHGFAGRLALLREFADEMDPVADRLVAVSTRYADQVVTINPAILAAIREYEQDSGTATPEERASFVKVMRELADTMQPAVAGLDELLRNLDGAKGISRDLAKPLGKMSKALSSLQDSNGLISQWVIR